VPVGLEGYLRSRKCLRGWLPGNPSDSKRRCEGGTDRRILNFPIKPYSPDSWR
jgi:hypothetical protein